MKIWTLIENHPGNIQCVFAHGLSLLVESEGRRILLDTGPDGRFAENAQQLGAELGTVEALVLSHGHYDHAGGMLRFRELNPTAPIYLQRSALESFYHGERYIGVAPQVVGLDGLVLLDGDREIREGVSVFAHVRGKHPMPRGSRQLSVLRSGALQPDDFAHEQCLVVREGARRVLFSGCAHTGILNILERFREKYGCAPDAVVSGFHIQKKERAVHAGGNGGDPGDCAGDGGLGHDVLYWALHRGGGGGAAAADPWGALANSAQRHGVYSAVSVLSRAQTNEKISRSSRNRRSYG